MKTLIAALLLFASPAFATEFKLEIKPLNMDDDECVKGDVILTTGDSRETQHVFYGKRILDACRNEFSFESDRITVSLKMSRGATFSVAIYKKVGDTWKKVDSDTDARGTVILSAK